MVLREPATLFLLLATSVSSVAFAQQPQPQQQPGSFQSGGLAPPSSTQPAQPTQPWTTAGPQQQQQPQWNQSETVRLLDESERDDAGRSLNWVYLNAEAGFDYVGLDALHNDGLTYGGIGGSGAGFLVGARAGVRVLTMTFGAHARLGLFKDWKLGRIGGEVGLHLPFGALEPYFTLGADYAFLASLKEDTWGGDVSIKGFGINLGFGLDYYLTSSFSVGGRLTGDFLFLSRNAVKIVSSGGTSSFDAAAAKTAGADGKGTGAGFTGALVLGLHF